MTGPINQPLSFYGYPVPNCCYSSDDAARYFCDDLQAMDESQLEAERSFLLHVMSRARADGYRRLPKVFRPDGNPMSFGTWASSRVERIDNILATRKAGAR